MKSNFFSIFFMALLVIFSSLFVGCGLDIPNTTKQIELSGKTDLPVGAQAVSAIYTVNTFDGKVASSQGTNYSVDSKTPYIWTLSYWDGSSWRRVFQIEADVSLNLTFYLPATYLLWAEAPTSFYSGVVENTTIPTQDELTIIVSEGSSYKASNFLPGQIVSTPFSSYFLRTEIVEIWGTGTYSPPPAGNDPVDPGNNDPGRAGTVNIGVSHITVSKGQTFTVEGTVEGLCDNFSGKFWVEGGMVEIVKIEAIAGSGWTIISGPGDMPRITATNSKPSSDIVSAFKITLKAKQITGTTGLNFQSCSASYKQEMLQANSTDGWVKIE